MAALLANLYDAFMGIIDFIFKHTTEITLIVLIWYTWETSKIRRITTQQRDLQLLPAMMFYVRHRSGTDRLFIRNVGFGAATTVLIPNADFLVGSERFSFRFHLTDSNNTLMPQEEREVGINFYKNDASQRNNIPNFMVYYNPARLQEVDAAGEAGLVRDIETPSQRRLKVTFKDIVGQQYETKIHFSSEGISIVESPRRTRG